MMTKMEKLYNSNKKVFSVQDLVLIWEIGDKKKLWNVIRYYLRTGKLRRIYKGLYCLESVGTDEYYFYELSQKLVVPSYISFYTALAIYGITFQYYSGIHAMSTVSKKYEVNGRNFVYHQLKENVFLNTTGIERKDVYNIASAERAICDSLYLVPHLAFDSLNGVDFMKLRDISKIYANKRLEEEVLELMENN